MIGITSCHLTVFSLFTGDYFLTIKSPYDPDGPIKGIIMIRDCYQFQRWVNILFRKTNKT